MNRRAYLVFAGFCIALSALGSGTVRAQDAPPAEIADAVMVCAGCHGDDGRPVTENTPIIWGQEEYYIYVQLRDIKAGRRANEIMSAVVADLSKDQMKALGKYFSKLSWPIIPAKVQDGDEAAANRIATAGQCTQCHLGAYVGNSRVPRTAGQALDYLQKTMLDLKYKRRKNAADMASLMESFSEDDIAAMARFLSALQPH